ncbi:MAG: imelysin family protein [Geminicoccaceae bacterium]
MLALLLVVPGAPTARAAVGEADYQRLATGLTEQVALPAVAAFEAATAAFAGTMKEFCAAPESADAVVVEGGFAAVMLAWQRVLPLDFGPLRKGDGPSRFQYWPDRRGTGGRQLARVLKDRDEAMLEPASLAGKSVALVDLQALERLLFEDDGPVDPFRCGYAAAIAAVQAERAAAMAADWAGPDGQAAAMRTASQGNDLYYEAAEAARDYLGALTHGLQRIVEARLTPVLGDAPATARPRAAESWRSGLSTANILANLDTLEALLTDPDGFAALAKAAGDPLIGRTIASMIGEARQTLESLPVPLAEAAQDPELHPKLTHTADLLHRAHWLTEHTLAATVGLTAGFNASDGD